MPHSWSQLGIEQDFFSLSIHTWIIKIHKYILFFQPAQAAAAVAVPHSCIQLSWQLQRFFFLSLYTRDTCLPQHFLSLFSSLSPLFSHLPVVTEPLLWLSLSTTLRIALVDSLSTYCSLWLYLYVFFSFFLSSYAHLSLSLSKKISFSHYKSTIVNKYYIFFIFSWLQIWGFESWNLLQNLDSTHK